MIAPLCLALLAQPGSLSVHAAPRQEDVAALVEALAKARDGSTQEDLERLAAYGSREAALGLVELYGRMETTLMRLEVVRCLARFDGVEEAQQPALQQLMDVATTAESRDLRLAALAGLGQGPGMGHVFLQRIVASPADDEVRVEALRKHVAFARPDDEDWYRELFDPERGRRRKSDKKRGGSGWGGSGDQEELQVHALPELRVIAFGALAPELSPRELLEATEDSEPDVRRKALASLWERDAKLAARRADELFSRIDEPASNRVLAARVLAEVKEKRALNDFVDVGTKLVTPVELRDALADLVAALAEDALVKKLTKLVGREKVDAHERAFALRALRDVEDSELTEKMARELDSEDKDLQLTALDVLGQRGDPEALPALEAFVERAEDPALVAAGLEAISKLRTGDPEWTARLNAFATGDETVVRNAALRALGPRPENLGILAVSLDHERWTTRKTAIDLLEELATKEVVPILVERLAEEDGRLRQQLGEALFRLTGKPFPPVHGNWVAWWAREGATFEIPSPEEFARLKLAARDRTLRMTTRAEFLGVQIESHRVTFVIDTSGSMNFPLRARYVGEGEGEPRIDVARRELIEAIGGLDPATLFNIVTFADGVSRWRDEGAGRSDAQGRREAEAWIERLAALGGTNLYGGLEAAFEDPDVDTIFLLSDGEPSVGDIIDPYAIRKAVERWNRYRGVVIHSLAVGTSLDVLAWLAEDSGGTYVEFR